MNIDTLFPLCHTYAQEGPKGPHYRCQHSDSERLLTETLVTTELQRPQEYGYLMEKIF